MIHNDPWWFIKPVHSLVVVGTWEFHEKRKTYREKKHRENRLLRVIPHPDMLFWHSFWHSIWHLFRHTLWHLFWHSFWHSIWHLFRHTLWHLFWHSFWHSIWRLFRHTLWHLFWHSMGLSENRVYSQWNSHLIGIMISKTIGFRGTLFSDTPIYLSGNEIRGAVHSHIRNDFTADAPSRGSDTLWPFGAGWCSLFVIWYVSFLQLWSL